MTDVKDRPDPEGTAEPAPVRAKPKKRHSGESGSIQQATRNKSASRHTRQASPRIHVEDVPTSDLAVFDFGDRPDYADFTRAASTGRRHPLTGFDPDYTDIVDYIVRCTHKIWEEKAVGLIYTHYSHNCTVHTSSGTMYGREAMVVNTLQRIAMYASRHAYADDVIWSGDDQVGFYSSHRVSSVGTNTGYSPYGPPTGRKVWRWGIADCFVRENKIVEEWLAHDGITEVRQMGYDPLKLARESVWPSNSHTFGEIDRLPTGQQAPAFQDVPPADAAPQAFVAAVLDNLWNARLINMVREHYAPGHLAFLPDSRKLYGHGDYENFVITLLACFPDLALTVGHQCVQGSAERGYRVATRFTLQGTHEGYGPYGAPTGRRVFLMGMSHHIIREGKVVQEWTIFDEFALLKQLYARLEA